MWWKGTLETPEWKREMDIAFIQLNNRTNSIAVVQKTLAANQNKIQHDLVMVKTKLDCYPTLETFVAHSMSCITSRNQE